MLLCKLGLTVLNNFVMSSFLCISYKCLQDSIVCPVFSPSLQFCSHEYVWMNAPSCMILPVVLGRFSLAMVVPVLNALAHKDFC